MTDKNPVVQLHNELDALMRLAEGLVEGIDTAVARLRDIKHEYVVATGSAERDHHQCHERANHPPHRWNAAGTDMHCRGVDDAHRAAQEYVRRGPDAIIEENLTAERCLPGNHAFSETGFGPCEFCGYDPSVPDAGVEAIAAVAASAVDGAGTRSPAGEATTVGGRQLAGGSVAESEARSPTGRGSTKPAASTPGPETPEALGREAFNSISWAKDDVERDVAKEQRDALEALRFDGLFMNDAKLHPSEIDAVLDALDPWLRPSRSSAEMDRDDAPGWFALSCLLDSVRDVCRDSGPTLEAAINCLRSDLARFDAVHSPHTLRPCESDLCPGKPHEWVGQFGEPESASRTCQTFWCEGSRYSQSCEHEWLHKHEGDKRICRKCKAVSG